MRAFSTLEFTSKVEPIWFMMRRIYEQIAKVVNGNVSFGDGAKADNIAGSWASVTTPVAPNTNFTINHNLGYIPAGYLLMQSDRSVNIYDGTVAATSTAITLKADVASAVIKVFVI